MILFILVLIQILFIYLNLNFFMIKLFYIPCDKLLNYIIVVIVTVFICKYLLLRDMKS